jgi:two-component system chemotaxis response regulator CheB
MLVKRMVGGYVTELSRGDPINRHRPSVDVLFNSMAAQVGASATAIILTGMGKDGARGMLAMHAAGAWTVAQDEASSIVYGMPREAVAIGAVSEVVQLQEIAERLLARLRRLDHCI